MADTTLLTLTEARDHLNVDASVKNGEIQAMCNAVALVVEMMCGPVDPVTYTSRVWSPGTGVLVLPHAQITAVTAVETLDGNDSGVDLAPGALRLDGAQGAIFSKASLWPVGHLWVTYTVGRSPVPANL